MITSRFEVLNQEELQTIHTTSMTILDTIGVKVDYAFARDLFRGAGASVDDQALRVRSIKGWVGTARIFESTRDHFIHEKEKFFMKTYIKIITDADKLLELEIIRVKMDSRL